MTPEQQRKHKEKLLQETTERHKNIDTTWEGVQASVRANAQSGGGSRYPTNTSDQRRQELMEEIEAKSKESQKALNIASWIVANPGRSPDELKHVAEPMVSNIRESYGSELADSFQALLEQSGRTTKGGSSTSQQTQRAPWEQIGVAAPTDCTELRKKPHEKFMKLKREREREDKEHAQQNKVGLSK